MTAACQSMEQKRSLATWCLPLLSKEQIEFAGLLAHSMTTVLSRVIVCKDQFSQPRTTLALPALPTAAEYSKNTRNTQSSAHLQVVQVGKEPRALRKEKVPRKDCHLCPEPAVHRHLPCAGVVTWIQNMQLAHCCIRPLPLGHRYLSADST